MSGHFCVTDFKPFPRENCSRLRCHTEAQEGVQYFYWCARCQLVYEYAFATEFGMLTTWAWLMGHHGGDGRQVIPQCPVYATYDDIADLTLRKLGQVPAGRLVYNRVGPIIDPHKFVPGREDPEECGECGEDQYASVHTKEDP